MKNNFIRKMSVLQSLETVSFEVLMSFVKEEGYPCIIKPTDGKGLEELFD